MNIMKKVILLTYISVASVESAMITPAFPQIQQVFNISTSTLDWLMTLFMLGYLICQLFFGPIANRYGRLTCLRIGFSINIAGLILGLGAAKFHSFELLLLSRFATALGAAVGLSGTFTLIREYMHGEEARAALSYAVLSFMFGIGLGVYFGGLLTDHFGWSATLWMSLGYGSFMFLSTFLFAEPVFERKSLHLKVILTGYIHALRNWRLIRYAIILGFITATGYIYSAAAPLIAEKFLHLNAHQYGTWNLLIMLGMLFGSLHGKHLVTQLGSHKTLMISLIGFVICLLVCVWLFVVGVPSPIIFFVFAAGLYYCGSSGFSCASYLATEGMHDQSNANGMMNFINLGFAVLSLVVLGYLPFSVMWSFLLTLTLGLICAVLMFLWQNRDSKN